MSEKSTMTVGRIQATDLSDGRFKYESEKGSPAMGAPAHGLSAFYTVEISVKGGQLPTDGFKDAKQAIEDRLTAAKQAFLDSDPLADRRQTLAALRTKRAELASAQADVRRHRAAALRAVADGADPKKHERGAIEAEERCRTLQAYIDSLPGEADQFRFDALMEMRGAISRELVTIRGEVAQRLQAALAALPQDLGEMLREAWVARELWDLCRPRRDVERTVSFDPLYNFVERLGNALPGGYNGRPREPSPYSTTPPDGLPPGASMGGPTPSPGMVAEAMGGYARGSPEPENVY